MKNHTTEAKSQYRAIIVDDAPQARKLLRLMIAELNSSIEIIAEAANATVAQELIETHQPDIVFLDIEMPGKSGIQLLESLLGENSNPDNNFKTIFITAYNQYAIQAFKLAAIDYLLKPVREEDLSAAIEKAITQIQLRNAAQQLNVFVQNLKQDQHKVLALPINYGYEYLPVDNIEYLEAVGAYTNFHLLKGKDILISKNLKHYENILCSLDFFAKVNRSYIVHLSSIKSYHKEDRGFIVLNSGMSIKLSPNYAEVFFEKFNKKLL